MRVESKSSNTCLTWGCGCLALVGVVVLVMVALGFFGFAQLGDYVENMKDPEVREQRAKELLGTEVLPEGYHAHFYLEVPFLAEVVALGDRVPVPIEGDEIEFDGKDLGRHIFFYFSMRDLEGKREEARLYFQGESDSRSFLKDIDIDVRPSDEIGRGYFELSPQTLHWIAYRGEFGDDFEDRQPGVYSMVLIECPDGSRLRMAMWFEEWADALDPSVELDPVGTPADEAALQDFMGHFQVCPSG